MTDDVLPSSASQLVTRRSVRGFVDRHRRVAFFALAYLFSWYPWLIALARGTATGPNPLGPFIAAVSVLALADGWQGVRALFARIFRGRIGLRYYAVVFALPIALCAIAAGLTSAVGFHPGALPAGAWRELPERFIFIFLFIGLGEEPGWRGFALPELQRCHSPLMASLILAPLWAVWHLPLFGHEFAWAVVPAFLLSLLGGTLVQTWLFNHTCGSVLAQMLLHATVNTVGGGLMFPLFRDRGLLALWSVYAVVWLAVGLLLILPSTRKACVARLTSRRNRPATSLSC
jgi:membrane protease YdiL (CAAX protease family)